ncbi:MAG: pentapeptide repeat-containing protein [Halobaculum sp.]
MVTADPDAGSRAVDGCEQDASDAERCYWHREEDGKTPEHDLAADDSFPEDLTDAYLADADLSDIALGAHPAEGDPETTLRTANLHGADLSGADLRNVGIFYADLRDADLSNASLTDADLTSAKLHRADLTDADFGGAELVGASLPDATLRRTALREANVSETDLHGATLVDAALSYADLTEADLRSATIRRSDLREATVSDLTLDRETTVERLTEPDADADPAEWDATARAYHDLKTAFADNSLIDQARTLHVRERRARRLETRAARGPWTADHLTNLLSEKLTGYGVSVWRVSLVMTTLLVGSTLVYALTDVPNPVAYSVVTFVTAAPLDTLPTNPLARSVALVETFFGTLLIILLGYILGNREQF